MNIVIVGNGVWGKNYVKTINEYFPSVKLKIATKADWWQLIGEKPQGVIIATPPDSHIKIALQALGQDIPCLIEKPLALSLVEAKKLEQFSHIPILVSHIHLFSSWYQEMKLIIGNKEITEMVSYGANNGPIRNYSSLWDYGPHDLSMILDLKKQFPFKININRIDGSECNMALYEIKLEFENNTGICKTTSLVGNGTNNKCRSIHVKFNDLTVSHRYQDDNINDKPLKNMLDVFFGGINEKMDARFGLQQAFNILNILENFRN